VGGALARTGWCQAASSSEPPTSVGLACRPVGAWRRHLVKRLQYNEESHKNEVVKIVYIASSRPFDGGRLEILGRSLARHLSTSTQHELRVCGGILRPDSPVFEDPVPDWAMLAEELDGFDIVYMEGGWNSDSLARFD
jgi:hypothetical protein